MNITHTTNVTPGCHCNLTTVNHYLGDHSNCGKVRTTFKNKHKHYDHWTMSLNTQVLTMSGQFYIRSSVLFVLLFVLRDWVSVLKKNWHFGQLVITANIGHVLNYHIIYFFIIFTESRRWYPGLLGWYCKISSRQKLHKSKKLAVHIIFLIIINDSELVNYPII